MFTKILAATNRPFDADPVVLAAARLAENLSASLHILHALPAPYIKGAFDFEPKDMPVPKPESRTGEESRIRRSMEKIYAPLLPSKIQRTIRIVHGEAWQEILTWAKTLKANLIVMGPHDGNMKEQAGRRRKTDRVGSTVQAVLRRERCPVSIVTASMAAHRMVFKRLLVAVDFSKSCECAVCFSVRAARHFRADVIIFHMIPVLPFPKYSQAEYRRDVVLSKQRVEAFCKDTMGDVLHHCEVWGGAMPYMEIVRCAELNQADAIIMGSHTKETGGKWYAGSAVERVAAISRSPVMVITDPAVLTPWKRRVSSRQNDVEKGGRLIRVHAGG